MWAGAVVVVMVLRDVGVEALVSTLQVTILPSHYRMEKCPPVGVHRPRRRQIEKEKGGMMVVGRRFLSALP
jgi:hypothetical protein